VWLLAVGGLQTLEHLLLPRVVARHGEGHQLIQGHRLLGVGLEQFWRNRGQPQPLLYHRDRDEERGGDLLLGLAGLAQD
jgi:hypothetical protein